VGEAGEGWHRVGAGADGGGSVVRGRDEMRGGSGAGDGSGWRRFGEPRNDGRSSDALDSQSRGDALGRDGRSGRGERDFGDSESRRSGARTSDPDYGFGDRGGRSGSFDRDRSGNSGLSERGGFRDYPGAASQPEAVRSDRSEGRGARESSGFGGFGRFGGFGDGGRRADPVQVNPPMVRERGGDRGVDFGGGRSGNDGYSRGERMSAPRMEMPRMESPRMEMPRSGPSGGGDRSGGSRGSYGGGSERGGSSERGGGGRRGN
jgi:hypothetical protein